MLVQAEYANGDVREMLVRVRRMMVKKEVYLQFLLHLNEDFDDDLLQDALELLS
jgi:hypothetical protein